MKYNLLAKIKKYMFSPASYLGAIIVALSIQGASHFLNKILEDVPSVYCMYYAYPDYQNSEYNYALLIENKSNDNIRCSIDIEADKNNIMFIKRNFFPEGNIYQLLNGDGTTRIHFETKYLTNIIDKNIYVLLFTTNKKLDIFNMNKVMTINYHNIDSTVRIEDYKEIKDISSKYLSFIEKYFPIYRFSKE